MALDSLHELICRKTKQLTYRLSLSLFFVQFTSFSSLLLPLSSSHLFLSLSLSLSLSIYLSVYLSLLLYHNPKFRNESNFGIR